MLDRWSFRYGESFPDFRGNYHKTIASLKKVFDNERLIFFDNIRKLFDLPHITKPSAISLRTMTDTVSAIYDFLMSIDNDKRIAKAILIHLVTLKVDPVSKSRRKEQLDFEKLPLWSDCKSALNKRYQHIAAEESSSSRQRFDNQKIEHFPRRNNRASLNVSKSNPSADKCLFCKSIRHSIANCLSFTAEPVSRRLLSLCQHI